MKDFFSTFLTNLSDRWRAWRKRLDDEGTYTARRYVLARASAERQKELGV